MKKVSLSNALLITHKDCCDGAGCACVFCVFGGKKENVRYVPAGNGVKDFVEKNIGTLHKYDHIVLTDISTDDETADLLEKNFDCVLLDHHKTALHLNKRDWCNVDMTECGTALFFDYCIQNYSIDNINIHNLYNFVSQVNDRDMWINKIPQAEFLAMYHYFFGTDKFVDRFFKNQYESFTEFEMDFLTTLLDKKQQYIKNVCDKSKIVNINGVNVGYTFHSEHYSDTLNAILIEKQCDLAIAFKMDSGNVSLRSTDNLDCSEIAKIFGGGGHKKASSFMLDKNIEKDIIEWFELNCGVYKER